MKALHFLQHKSRYVSLFVVVIAMAVFSQSTLTVNVDSAQNVISKDIFGVLMEMNIGRGVNDGIFVGGTSGSTNNTNGMRTDIINGFKEAGVGIIEWPGGCASNGYNWQTGNGANAFGIDRYMQLCQLVGSTPCLAGRPNTADTTLNKSLVTYVNNSTTHPEWTVNYFKIGNEVWGCGGNYNEASYQPNYTANYNALKNPINGKKLFFVAGTELIGSDNWQWTKTMIQNIGSQIDGIEVHDYIYHTTDIPCVNFTDAQYYNVVNAANAGQIGPRLAQLIPIMDQLDPSKRIKIIEDEWGDWFETFGAQPFFQQITVMDALSTAEQLHIFMSHADRVKMTGLAQAINVIHSLFLTQQNSPTGPLVKTPSFYIYKMFIPHHTANAKWAPNTLKSENITGGGLTMPAVSAGTSVDSIGRVNISLSNVDPTNTRVVNITLNGSQASYNVTTAQIVTGPLKNSYNDFGKTELVNIQTLPASNYTLTGKTLKVTLPAISTVMLVLTPPGVGTLSALIEKNAANTFSITAGANRTVMVSSSVNRNTPVTISLYSVDGKSLMDKSAKILKAGSNTVAFGNNCKGSGVCIVKIVGEGFTVSKRVMIAK
jgi:alpha-N-arabinofuranosidase